MNDTKQIEYKNIQNVPDFSCTMFAEKKHEYIVLIPIINEGKRIHDELHRAQEAKVSDFADIVICDGGSNDGSTDENILIPLSVNTLLVKRWAGKQGAQLRMGFWFAKERGYKGIITIDGNNKDSIEDVPKFIQKLNAGFDFVQGSRFVKGGKAINTPVVRLLSVKLIHAPIISLTARKHFTDTTNAYRAYSSKFLFDARTCVFRDVFMGYELLAYLSVRATQLDYKACEIPVTREYPKTGKTPTKITFFKGNWELMKILIKNLFGAYKPKEGK